MVKRRGRAEVRVRIVPVDALGLYLFSVDVKDPVADGKVTQADKETDMFCADREEKTVKTGGFVAPEFGSGYGNFKGCCVLGGQAAFCKGLAPGCFQTERKVCLAVQGGKNTDLSGRKIGIQIGLYFNIGQMYRLAFQEINLTENARKTKFVLILQIGAVAPFEDHHRQRIGAAVQIFCEVYFVAHVADLSIGGENAVDEEIKTGIHALEIQIVAMGGQPRGGDFYVTHIKPAGILIRHKRRIEGEGVVDIGIVGQIVAPAKAGLPAARDGELVHIFTEKSGHTEIFKQ